MLRHILIVTVFCHVTLATFQFSNHEIGHNMMHETNIENLEKFLSRTVEKSSIETVESVFEGIRDFGHEMIYRTHGVDPASIGFETVPMNLSYEDVELTWNGNSSIPSFLKGTFFRGYVFLYFTLTSLQYIRKSYL